MGILVNRKNVGNIPVLELYETDNTTKRPMVLLYHGYMGRKEFILPQAYYLVSSGFYVVVPDAVGHGDRGGTQIINLLTAITETTAEINDLIDSFEGHSLADKDRVGLAGYSMGGCISFAYLAEPRKQIKAAVPIISTPEWTSIVDGFSTKEKLEELKGHSIIEKDEDIIEFRNFAEKLQPINHFQEMKNIPLLMLCGEKDEVTPAKGVVKLYESLEPLTDDKESLQYKIYPGIGHADTVEMNTELIGLFKKYLQLAERSKPC